MCPPDAPDAVPDRFSVDFTGLTLLGIYRVEEKLAEGGMGSIYRGVDTNLDRPVVIKVPHVRFLGEPGFRRRFRLEITELVRLEHPGIVRILAQGEHEEVPFFVLQFLGGGSLEEVLDRSDEPSSVEDVLAWLVPIARTLDFVHGRGTVHRDVKPANILFDEDGNVYLSDFGVAKALESEDAALTAAGTGIGSPRYMAPEQAVGDDLDPTADQYALASMVYEALAGHPPFKEPSAIDLLIAKKSTDAAPLHEVAPQVPPEASAAVMRALARTPSERFPSCQAFLEALSTGLRPPAPAASASPARWALPVALLVLALLATWWATRDRPPAPPPPVAAATNEVGELRLVLLEAGDAERTPFRYALRPGSVEPVHMHMKKKLSATGGGQELPAWASPSIDWNFEVEVEEVRENGDYRLQWRTTSLAFEHHEDAPQDFRDAMERFRPLYETFACEVVMTPNGMAREAQLRIPEDTNEIIRRELMSLFWTIRNLSIPFPVEPVGVGAMWQVSENADLVGIRLSHTMTYELKAAADGRVTLVAHAAQMAPQQRLNMTGIPTDVEATLVSLHTNGSSTLEGDLTHACPRAMSSDMEMQMQMKLFQLDEDGNKGGADEAQRQRMSFEMEMTVERKDP